MGVLRLDLNCDYDRLHHVVNHDSLARQMLGHPDIFDKRYYHMQTIKDNVSLLIPELLDEINQIIVKAGYILLKKKENSPLRGRCDSFVCETNVHFPTDINLLYDAMRKVIKLSAELCEKHRCRSWRQYAYNIKHVKRLMRTAQNKKRACAKSEEQKKKRDALIIEAHQEYIDVAKKYVNKARHTLNSLENQCLFDINDSLLIEKTKTFIHHAVRQINQLERRVIFGEIIPHNEKVFSLFQPHTEWVMKGKAGVPVELGVKVCVMENHDQFILHHRVMEKKTDDEVAVPMVDETKKRFPGFSTCSFDKGSHSPNNQKELNGKLDIVAISSDAPVSNNAHILPFPHQTLPM